MGPADGAPPPLGLLLSWPADRGQTTQVAKWWLLLCINVPGPSVPYLLGGSLHIGDLFN